jgi:hypothetical protein
MRVGTRAAVVSVRRLDSAARVAAEVVRQAGGADTGALGRFLSTFVDQLRASDSSVSSTPARSPPTRNPLRSL